MHIANPIYDVVFKYLMEDQKIAKLLISSIIGEDIIELVLRPQEFVSKLNARKSPKEHARSQSLTVYRLDFSAKIKTKSGGYRLVLIEIQKAKYYSDIMRFRSYLGAHYSNKDNTHFEKVKTQNRRVGTPIVCIYFLGHILDYAESAVIGIRRNIVDLITQKPILEKETFIESLTHNSYVIQIPRLTHKRRNELETLLSVFDQSTKIDANHHILNIKEEDFPEKHRMIIRRLQKAVLVPDLQKKMDLEDGIIDELDDMQRNIEELQEQNEFERLKTLAEKQRAEQEKQRAEQEKQRAEQEKQRAEQERQRAEIAEKELAQLKRELKKHK